MRFPSRNLDLPGYDGWILQATFQPSGVRKPLVVMAHDLAASRDWGFLPTLAGAFADAGFPTLRFDFSGAADPGAFERDTLTRRGEDLRAVLAAVRSGALEDLPSPAPVFLWGHGWGGGVALTASVGDPSVAALAAWGCVSRFDRFPFSQVKAWRERGFHKWTPPGSPTPLRSGRDFLDDLDKWRGLGDIPVEAFRLKAPVLLVHGLEDEVFRPSESESLAAILPTARLVMVEGAGHDFVGGAYLRALSATLSFFQRSVGPG